MGINERPKRAFLERFGKAFDFAPPLDLEDFAIGFSLAERIVDQPSQIYDIVVVSNTAILGIELQIQIASACFVRLKINVVACQVKPGAACVVLKVCSH